MSDRQPSACLSGDRLQLWAAYFEAVQLPGLIALASIPEGNSWDGATIPRLCWSVMGHPLEADLRRASLWHDRLCEQTDTIEQRGFADAVFLELLRQSSVGFWRRWAMWLAVRCYGVAFRRRGQ